MTGNLRSIILNLWYNTELISRLTAVGETQPLVGDGYCCFLFHLIDSRDVITSITDPLLTSVIGIWFHSCLEKECFLTKKEHNIVLLGYNT